MRLVGILNWYNEQPAWLAATVASMARAGMTHLIALDGAYAAYPDGRGASPPDEQATVLETCRGMGVGCTLHSPAEPWLGNEVEKRTFGFRLADLLTTDEDWVMLMDADQIIVEAPPNLPQILDGVQEDVAAVRFTEPNTHAGYPVRLLFRCGLGIRLIGDHTTYVDGAGRLLALASTETAAADLARVVVEHRTGMRRPERKTAQETYYRRRDQLGLETVPA